MSIKNNITAMNDFICTNDPENLEKFLSYSDSADILIRSYISTYGSYQLQNISKGFRGRVLKDKINIICE